LNTVFEFALNARTQSFLVFCLERFYILALIQRYPGVLEIDSLFKQIGTLHSSNLPKNSSLAEV